MDGAVDWRAGAGGGRTPRSQKRPWRTPMQCCDCPLGPGDPPHLVLESTSPFQAHLALEESLMLTGKSGKSRISGLVAALEIKAPGLWICTSCWKIMPRAEAEHLELDQSHLTVQDLRCSSCNAVGKFVPESSPEFAEFANDLLFEAFAASLQTAGYEVLMYSAECDQENHGHCPGKNRLTGEIPYSIPASFGRCFCPCHESSERSVTRPHSSDHSEADSQAETLAGLYKERARELKDIARVLQCIGNPPNRRDKPKPDDLNGVFDFWFDGGAAQQITGWTEYKFSDGIRAKDGVTPCLSITIDLPNGIRVRIKQEN